ncbi:conserved repeat domain-containing protein/Por secretion system C-terminal sorting domain-containing protein [Catalinimonas alkaloidigena]|uniref:Conserved repeat domain-containing protein/Por secretion system C-terminal sorting domain-containing protein n=1 Tax=Catalinimonas alkaloidigena TaxID=1075417 RepID=A0A1G9HBP6_9BACT|nr:ELWxxDGT repeat protein [Catalinimonas alkaloidigena]SDL10329.1 conserved repeat domain-containing protein/Por secretion system C-terminal sorting domain-containing protein [Catalinimonas alkaloidigena]
MRKLIHFLLWGLITHVTLAQVPVMVKDITNGPLSTTIKHPTVYQDKLYFFAGTDQMSLWVSDGTEAGTKILKSFPAETAYWDSLAFWTDMTVSNDLLFFAGADIENGIELWRSDGTEEGTYLFKDLVPGPESSYPQQLINSKDTPHAVDTLFFTVGGWNETQLWYSDGTLANTLLAKEGFVAGSMEIMAMDAENVYFLADKEETNLGKEIWSSNDLESSAIKDLYIGSTGFESKESTVYTVAEEGQFSMKLFLATHDYFDDENYHHPAQLWKIQSYWTLVDRVQSVLNLNEALGQNTEVTQLVSFEDKLLINAQNEQSEGLWVTDHNAGGLMLLWEGACSEMKEWNGRLYFGGNITGEGYKLWSTDGTLEGTRLELNPFEGAPFELSFEYDGALYLTSAKGSELWRTNGTLEGMQLVHRFEENGAPQEVFPAKSMGFFMANDGLHGQELWRLSTPVVTGLAYIDQNGNGHLDEGEPGLPNQAIVIMPDSLIAYTNNEGIFIAHVDSGDYTLTVPSAPDWKLTSTPVSYSVSVPQQKDSFYTFGLQPQEARYGLSTKLAAAAPSRCGFEVTYWLTFQNRGTLPASGMVRLIADTSLTFISSSLIPEIREDTLTWAYTDLLPKQSKQIRLTFEVPGFEQMGDTLYSFVHATIQNGEELAFATADTLEQVILCSYDPNDKQVEPAGILEEHYTLKGEWLEYLVRFQNTGNAEALTVEIRDTLDARLDLTTFESLSASHALHVTRQGRNVSFLFEDINLPDSTTNEPESHGYVRYRIKAQAGVPEETVVRNTAHIYFDRNPAIVTNTTFNTLVTTLPKPTALHEALPDASVRLFPNPTTGLVTVRSETPLERVRVLTVMGQEVLQVSPTSDRELTLDVQTLPAGLYLVEITRGGHRTVQRISKQ